MEAGVYIQALLLLLPVVKLRRIPQPQAVLDTAQLLNNAAVGAVDFILLGLLIPVMEPGLGLRRSRFREGAVFSKVALVR